MEANVEARSDEPPIEGVVIKRWRERLGLSARAVAPKVGISHTRWLDLERGVRNSGRTKTAGRPETYARMAIAIGITPEDVLLEARLSGHSHTDRQRLRALAGLMSGRMHLGSPTTDEPPPLTLAQVKVLLGALITMTDGGTLRLALEFYGLIAPEEPEGHQTNVS